MGLDSDELLLVKLKNFRKPLVESVVYIFFIIIVVLAINFSKSNFNRQTGLHNLRAPLRTDEDLIISEMEVLASLKFIIKDGYEIFTDSLLPASNILYLFGAQS